ncbi:GNAT family N-acetyltransferase [Vibrio sp. ZSDE26]|uniref:GNAT family N-acetyltransferase n=1 Tax=Vibrio amylolyticus TaxID=2847292 RepID=A0A9X2BHE3_9VIBR|nr:GNAT family N-acetyltransferase [Vibrio amylolyticus]
MIIRNQLKPTDLGRIILLHSEFYSERDGYDHTFEAYVAEPLAQFALIDSVRENIWIVEDDQGIAGVICICELTQDRAQLRWFIVHQRAQGQGLGRELISMALQFCRDQDYSKVVLWTAKGLDKAKDVYLKNGFELTQERTHPLWGVEVTEQCYELDL